MCSSIRVPFIWNSFFPQFTLMRYTAHTHTHTQCQQCHQHHHNQHYYRHRRSYIHNSGAHTRNSKILPLQNLATIRITTMCVCDLRACLLCCMAVAWCAVRKPHNFLQFTILTPSLFHFIRLSILCALSCALSQTNWNFLHKFCATLSSSVCESDAVSPLKQTQTREFETNLVTNIYLIQQYTSRSLSSAQHEHVEMWDKEMQHCHIRFGTQIFRQWHRRLRRSRETEKIKMTFLITKRFVSECVFFYISQSTTRELLDVRSSADISGSAWHGFTSDKTKREQIVIFCDVLCEQKYDSNANYLWSRMGSTTEKRWEDGAYDCSLS